MTYSKSRFINHKPKLHKPKNSSLNFIAAYAYFCDDNNLPRIDATPKQKRENLVLMARCLVEEIDHIDKPEPVRVTR